MHKAFFRHDDIYIHMSTLYTLCPITFHVKIFIN